MKTFVDSAKDVFFIDYVRCIECRNSALSEFWEHDSDYWKEYGWSEWIVCPFCREIYKGRQFEKLIENSEDLNENF